MRTVFGDFFAQFDRAFYYDKTNPGFYIENRKLCSLGFRYKNGVSLHGVSLNVDVDLEFHNRINPCGLQNVIATSLKHEGIDIDCNEVDRWIVGSVVKVFDESL
ncbi:Octanoyltransferase [compost metagenome]